MKEVSFADLKLNKQLLTAVADLGYEKPTEIQRTCIPVILAGQHVIGIAQTGTGKTAAYLLPILMLTKFASGNEPRTLILVPTKELAVQVAEHARQVAKYTDLRILALFGGIGPKTQIESLQRGVDVVVSTPGRFTELYLKGELSTKQIRTLVLDEADRMMDMGFMPQLRKIFEVIPHKRQNLLFSATFPEKVERLAAEFLVFPVRIEISPPATPASQVKQELYYVPNIKSKINFLEWMLLRSDFIRVMIFTRTKETADNVGNFVDRKNLGPVRIIHSNKGQNSRINAVNEFKAGTLRVLVSTDVTSRGIDVTGVSHVINFDVPVVYEDYVHRIGRTGRAFQTGTAITLANEAEIHHVRNIESLIREQIPVKELPAEVVITETQKEEKIAMAREIDRQKRKADPLFKGAFHEPKKRKR